MATGLKQLALGALCSSVLIAITGVAQAATVSLSGSPLSAASTPNPLYGASSSENNVVNAPGTVPATGSLLYDPTATPNGAFNSATTPWLQQGQVSANTGGLAYYVNWYFTGAESGYDISFKATSDLPDVTFTESNQNNSATAADRPSHSGLMK